MSTRARQRVAQVVAALLLLGVAVLAGWDLRDEWHGAHTLAQRSVSVAVTTYCLFGIIAGVGVVMRKRWSVACAIVWSVASIYAAGTSVLAYGGGGAAAALPAYLGAGAICALVVWLTRYATRSVTNGVTTDVT